MSDDESIRRFTCHFLRLDESIFGFLGPTRNNIFRISQLSSTQRTRYTAKLSRISDYREMMRQESRLSTKARLELASLSQKFQQLIISESQIKRKFCHLPLFDYFRMSRGNKSHQKMGNYTSLGRNPQNFRCIYADSTALTRLSL